MLWNLDIIRPSSETLQIVLVGDCNIKSGAPDIDAITGEFRPNLALSFDASALGEWDSTFLTFLLKIEDCCARNKMRVERNGLPDGVQKMLHLATAVPARQQAPKEEKDSFLHRVGDDTVEFCASVSDILSFIGEAVVACVHLMHGKARFRMRDFLLNIQECGAQALPVVTLISVLIGLILAFVGALQLKMFGAEIYVANLVAVGMAREMGAMMPGIIMAGRTGASFAAQLGTMQVNEEIDALKTMGFSPMEFLVLPRMLAMAVMMPVLCIYSIFLGIMGGALVSIYTFDITASEYFHQTAASMGLTSLWIGVVKSVVFGVLVAVAGCLRGIQCGRSSAAVGAATTSAVVTGIVSIIVADSIMTIIISVLDI